MDACRLRGGNPFSAPVKETGLQQPSGESRMVLMNCAPDGVFPAPRELEPRCDLGRHRCQCPRLIFRDNIPVLRQVNGFSVDTHSGDRFKRDASTLIGEREVKRSNVFARTMQSAHRRKECTG